MHRKANSQEFRVQWVQDGIEDLLFCMSISVIQQLDKVLLLNYLSYAIGHYCYFQVKKQEVTLSLETLKCQNEKLERKRLQHGIFKHHEEQMCLAGSLM